MEVIEISDEDEEVQIPPDLVKIAKHYNVCVVVKIKGVLPVKQLVDELTSAPVLEDCHFDYCGAQGKQHFFALRTRWRKKYIAQAVRPFMQQLGPLITHELIILRCLL